MDDKEGTVSPNSVDIQQAIELEVMSKLYPPYNIIIKSIWLLRVRVMVLNATFKSLTNFITECCIEYTPPWTGLELTTLVVIETDCIGSYKSNYHTTTTAPTQCLFNEWYSSYDKHIRTVKHHLRVQQMVFVSLNSNTTGTTCEAGTVHPSGAPVFSLGC